MMKLIGNIEKGIFIKQDNQNGFKVIWKVYDYYPEIESAKLVSVCFRVDGLRNMIRSSIDTTPITQKILKKDGVFYIESIAEFHKLFMCDENEIKQHIKNVNEAAIAKRLSDIRSITKEISDIMKMDIDTDFEEFMKNS